MKNNEPVSNFQNEEASSFFIDNILVLYLICMYISWWIENIYYIYKCSDKLLKFSIETAQRLSCIQTKEFIKIGL